MSTFTSLLKVRQGTLPGDAQKSARQGFAARVKASKMALRKPGTPISSDGTHLVLGVASYATKELKLLDRLERSLVHNGAGDFEVEVFDVLDCKQANDFKKFIPGVGEVCRTPVVGVIRDGALVQQATGLSEVESTLRRFHILGQ